MSDIDIMSILKSNHKNSDLIEYLDSRYISSVPGILTQDNSSEIYIVNPIDISSMKKLYNNCIRMGEINKSNVTVASVDPSLWFDQIFDLLHNSIKIIVDRPHFILVSRINGKIFSTSFECKNLQFDTDDDLKKFFEVKFRNLAVMSICKFVNLQTLKSYWLVRACDAISKEIKRELKIDSMIE